MEEAFSKVKTVIKTYEQELELDGMDLKDLVLLAFGPTNYRVPLIATTGSSTVEFTLDSFL